MAPASGGSTSGATGASGSTGVGSGPSTSGGSFGNSAGGTQGSVGSSGQANGSAGQAAAGAGSVAAGGLPCALQAMLKANCQACHGTTPVGGAPMSLVTYSDLTKPSLIAPSSTNAQRAAARMQDATRPMPPSGLLPAADAALVTNWIAANYPMETASSCSGGGNSGSGGASASGGSTSTATGGSTAAGGSPSNNGGSAGATSNNGPFCAVQSVVQNRCISCHGPTPAGGAPMSLATYANLTAPSSVNPSQTNAQRALARMQNTSAPMPPVPATPATSADMQAFANWIAAGYPTSTCGSGTGSGGAGGTTSTGAGGSGSLNDPFAVAPICTSNQHWTGGNDGSSLMNPGRACISCHASGGGGEDGGGPLFSIAGTVYPTAHEPDLCYGVNGGNGAEVVIVDAQNHTITLTPNAAGNFTYSGSVATPFHAKVVYQGRERSMVAAQTSGDCNSCHTQNGSNSAPGRILLP